MKTNIRPLEEADIPVCANLYVDVYNRAPWNYDFSFERAKAYLLEYMLAKRFEGFALMHDGAIKGAILAHSKTWWTGDILYIDELFVSPESQGLGYGRQLLTHMHQHAGQKGYDVVTLMTNRHMPAAKFYETLGYLPAEHFVMLFNPVPVIA